LWQVTSDRTVNFS